MDRGQYSRLALTLLLAPLGPTFRLAHVEPPKDSKQLRRLFDDPLGFGHLVSGLALGAVKVKLEVVTAVGPFARLLFDERG